MSRHDFAIYLLAYLLALLCVALSRREGNRKLIIVFGVLAIAFISQIALTWGKHAVRVRGEIDSGFMYRGAVAAKSPYVTVTEAQSPTFFAYARFLLGLGDGSRESWSQIVDIHSFLGIIAILSCILFLLYESARKEGFSSNVVCIICMTVGAILPATINIDTGNIYIWVGGLVSLYLLTVTVSKSNVTSFFGGVLLALAFMLKPYLLIVLAYVFFSSLKEKKYGQLAGLVVTGVLGFLCSLSAPGIGIDTYVEFLTKVSHSLYFYFPKAVSENNLSLIKFVPTHMARLMSNSLTLLLLLLVFIDSRRPKSSVIPWFFVTLLPLPFIWGLHVMGIYPAFIFFLTGKRWLEQIVICGVVGAFLLYSCVFHSPIISNVLLASLWLWGLLRREDS